MTFTATVRFRTMGSYETWVTTVFYHQSPITKKNSNVDLFGLIIKCLCSAVVSTSERVHTEFLRLFYILTHKHAVNFLTASGEDEPTRSSSSRFGGIDSRVLLRSLVGNVLSDPTVECV